MRLAEFMKLTIETGRPDPEAVSAIAGTLASGGVVALPTDTVYGLCADALNAEAVSKVAALKGRSWAEPFPWFVLSEDATRWADAPNETTSFLAERLWPGPYTVIFRATPEAKSHLFEGQQGIGLRHPDSRLIEEILRGLARPIIGTSANKSGSPPLRSCQEVENVFGGDIDGVVDGGECETAQASVVLDVTECPYKVLRGGRASAERLETLLGARVVFLDRSDT